MVVDLLVHTPDAARMHAPANFGLRVSHDALSSSVRVYVHVERCWISMVCSAINLPVNGIVTVDLAMNS